MGSVRSDDHCITRQVVVPADVPGVVLFGSDDAVLRALEQGFVGLDVHLRGDVVTLHGPAAQVATCERLIEEMIELARSGAPLTADVIARSIDMLVRTPPTRPASVLSSAIVQARGRVVRPRTAGQKAYVDAIDANTITFGIGPAGSGKTYLAMAKAVQALQSHQVARIVLTRPAVEAGERLGFLPGTLTEKIDPYLRPLYDALYEMVEADTVPRLVETGTVEVAPLAYMRGRTLNDAFIILDEAQNTTAEQMKMFLTRLGFGSRMVVTGDVTQVDLPAGARSGLRIAEEVLAGVDDIAVCHLGTADVVRHRLVGDIIEAYERWEGPRR